ncbi:MAG TPA: phenylalanine--tRNA ligase subunit alpha [Vicinamibacteria bacterium]|nr:phenylalanine--tRNA ligase subunit alpha [Vicinamibacteria bacterium]
MGNTLEQLREQVRGLRAGFESGLAEARDASGLQGLRDRFLGRKAGAVTALLKTLAGLAEEARREAGQELNQLKAEMESRLQDAKAGIEARLLAARLSRERVDLSLPGRPAGWGRKHPLTAVREELEDIFLAMGYEVYDGPEVEDDFHCFEALNLPPDHPARDMQDTFYLAGKASLLRTHTSSGQIRYLLSNPHPPEVRIICPGKVFRRDNDITHSPMFQQVEGLVVGAHITLGDLKGTLEAFLRRLFGPQFPVRFRSSFFPYTEPSVEVDLGCVVCGGGGCRVCKGTGWLEILGSGMVHPAVFEAVNARLGRPVYDPETISGFAFGLGIERVAMVRHSVDDIRLFYENDLRFLEQLGG